MALTAGTKLGPYEVVGPIGAGGMGEVYRARDTRLERTVAIKVLPSHLSTNIDLKQRFEREAKAISSLQHPHICTLYDVGSQEGVDFLVMEYLEGETLAERLVKGPLKIDEALKIGIAIADALDRAHRQGIVHRDLKPGNVMLTKSGAKLMDFGLAKPAALAMGANASHPSNTGLGGPPSPNTPTMSVAALTSPASPLTQKGTIVGTFQYMAPEVLQGVEADARSDIFSFGCVLYEMITGRRAFEGKSQVSVLAAILDKEPEPITTVQPLTPPAVEFVIRTCLAKDPEERFQTARDAALQLRWAATSPATANAAGPPAAAERTNRPLRRWIFATVGTIGLIVAALAGYWWANPGSDAEPVRAVIEPPEKTTVDTIGDFAGAPVLSPDGKKLLFAAHTANSPRVLWVRPLDSFEAQRLDGTEGAYAPFWSPDGSAIGFFTAGKLNRIPANGGPVTTLAAAPNSRGGTWLKGDTIVFSPDFQTALSKVSATGGNPEPATKLDTSKHSTHRWPFALPDGKHFLYLATSHSGGSSDQNGIYFASLDGKENKLIVATDGGGEYASGYLLYHAGTSLVAQPFDPSSGRLSGAPQPLVNKVRADSGVWRILFTTSQNGRMVYQTGSSEASGSQLVWKDRSGKEIGVVGPHAAYMDPAISPDGKRVAVSYGDPNREIWVFDTERGTQTRLTFFQTSGSAGAKLQPSWSPDGRFIAYQYTRTTNNQLGVAYSKPANGSGQEKLLVKLDFGSTVYPSWSPDGKYVVYTAIRGPTGSTIEALPVAGGQAFVVVPAASLQSNILNFRISPNGKWIAYVSNESGQPEIYIAPFPKGDGKWQVSTQGANTVAWRNDGKELYYSTLAGTDYMACVVKENGNDLVISTPQKMFNANPSPVGLDFDAAPDGKRFLVNVADNDQTPTTLHLVTNWTADLKKK